MNGVAAIEGRKVSSKYDAAVCLIKQEEHLKEELQATILQHNNSDIYKSYIQLMRERWRTPALFCCLYAFVLKKSAALEKQVASRATERRTTTRC